MLLIPSLLLSTIDAFLLGQRRLWTAKLHGHGGFLLHSDVEHLDHPDHVAFADSLLPPIAGYRVRIDYQAAGGVVTANNAAALSRKSA